MKHLLLAVGATLVLGVPSMASPDFKSDPTFNRYYFQAKPITGKVTDDKGEPLAGVTVQVKGLKSSAVTKSDGTFSIDVPNDAATLVFSFVGMERKEVSISGKTNFQIALKTVDTSLSDVVVVGYATQKKAHLTGSVESIKAEEIQDLPVGNLSSALSGRILGVSVSGGMTRPGVGGSLTIRNPMSLAKDGGNLQPLYVIDGVIQVDGEGRNDNSLFNSLDASEIENITVLKDATAAIYGSRGAQGVILVQTRRGKIGAPRISYSGSYGINDEAYRSKMLSAYEFAQYYNIMNGPNGANHNPTDKRYFFSADELEHFKNIDYDWLEPAWKSASNMRHTLNISGGAERATYFANVSYFTQNGNLSSLDYKKYTFRAGADINVLAGLKTGLQVSGNFAERIKTFNKIGGENDENDYRNLLLAPRYIPMYLGDYAVKLPGTDQLSQYHFYEIEKLRNLAENKDKTMTLNLYAEYEVPFIKGLKARASYNRNFGSGIGSQVGTVYDLYEFTNGGEYGHIYDQPTDPKGKSYKNGNRLYYSNRHSEIEQMNFTMSYGRTFGRHNISGLFSVEKSESTSEQQDVLKEDPLTVTNGQFNTAFGIIDGKTDADESGSLGYIGRLNYNFSEKYLAEFLFRSDASTKFAPENYWGKFYSLSAGWVISKENFFNVPGVNYLKLRYSAGLLGKDDTKAWQWRQRYTFQNGKGPVVGGNSLTQTGMKMEASPNRNATWSDEFKNNLGIDARFLNSRLSATIEGFYNHATNMLIERTESLPLTIGGTVAAENWGEAKMFGYEIGLGWNDRINDDFHYGIDARFSWYDNKVIKGNFNDQLAVFPWEKRAGESDDNGVWGYDYLGMFKTQADIDAYVKEYNITSFVFDDDEVLAKDFKPGMLYYTDVRGAIQPDGTFAGPDGIINEYDQIQLAKKANNHYGFGMTLKLGYKDLSFNAVIAGSFGGYSEIDGTSRKKMNNDISRTFQSRPVYWSNIYDEQLNPGGIYPNPHWDFVSLSPMSTFWQVSGFRMRMRNATLSYSLPKRVAQAIRVSNARINLTALNPINFFNPYDYKDSEGAYDTYPVLRTYSLGINLTL